MTPYHIGKQMVIDPTIPPNKLHFGPVVAEIYGKIGTVIDRKYVHPVKCDCYRLDFGNKKDPNEYWFKETEIC